MKKLLFISFVLSSLLGCSDEDLIEKNVDPINVYKTGKDYSISYSTSDSYNLSKEPFNALGYGYDITGKYAHPNWIRGKVVDPQEYENDEYYGVMRDFGLFIHAGLGTITGTKEDIITEMLSDIKADGDGLSKYKNVLKGMFELPFENDTTFKSSSYYYAVDAFASRWYSYEFYTHDVAELYNYLTKEFKSDLITKSGEEIINLYGTHVLMCIETGVRQDFYYRTTSEQELQKRMVYNSGKYLESTPGIWMSPEPGEYMDKENLYTEFIGGVHTYPNAWMFDITNYTGSLKLNFERQDLEKSDIVLVNFGSRAQAITPIYEFIEDPLKREEVYKAYINYLNN